MIVYGFVSSIELVYVSFMFFGSNNLYVNCCIPLQCYSMAVLSTVFYLCQLLL